MFGNLLLFMNWCLIIGCFDFFVCILDFEIWNIFRIILCVKTWSIRSELTDGESVAIETLVSTVLDSRGLRTPEEQSAFLSPKHPRDLTPGDVGIDARSLEQAVERIRAAIDRRESIVVHADYDADGISAGAVMWETLHALGARVMPYVPKRESEGRGMPKTSIDAIVGEYRPTLLITVDHGITARESVAYARSLGIDFIVTDHHEKPSQLPECTIVHTTDMAGAGVSWFLAHAVATSYHLPATNSLLELAAIGTVADCVPLIGANRSIAKYGLEELRRTKRVGIKAILADAGAELLTANTYTVSHLIAPRINAMGRLEHALDALRLLCTKDADRAGALAGDLGLTNRRRQDMTSEMHTHARTEVAAAIGGETAGKLLFVSSTSYNQGIVGLVAGKLVEEYYRPAIVIAEDAEVSKGSARSIAGVNIIEIIRRHRDLLVDVGGHPLAAGFTIESRNISVFADRMREELEREVTDDLLTRSLMIEAALPFSALSLDLWEALQQFQPFGFGNPEPVFCTRGVTVTDTRSVGREGAHLKLVLSQSSSAGHQRKTERLQYDAIAFGMGAMAAELAYGSQVDVAYTVDRNVWNGSTKLQLKVKDIRISS